MVIKIIKHKQKQKKYAYHFVYSCGCEFWSDSEDVLMARSLNPYYEIKCPECGHCVRSYDRPILRSEIFGN